MKAKQHYMKGKYLIIPFLSIPACLFFLFLIPTSKPTTTTLTTTTTTRSRRAGSPGGLRIRAGYSSYESYIEHQLNKTLNPKLRQIWRSRDWERKIRVFAGFFEDLKRAKLLSNSSRALCVGARMGQEVERTLRPRGLCVLHVALSRRSDKYSANDLFTVDPLKNLFKRSHLIRLRAVDAFGLDTELVFRKIPQ